MSYCVAGKARLSLVGGRRCVRGVSEVHSGERVYHADMGRTPMFGVCDREILSQGVVIDVWLNVEGTNVTKGKWMCCCIQELVHSGVLFDSTRSWCGEVLCLCSDL